MARPINDITCKKFNKLTAIKYIGDKKWLFKCDCGNEKIMEPYSLYRKDRRVVKSCGCLLKEYSKSKFNLSHGMSNSRFYKIFDGIKDRCNRKEKYKGIKCLWLNFEEFKKDMYGSYLEHVNKFGEKQTTIDRINGKDNYYKDNCRWATYKEQNVNRVFKKK